MGDICCYWFTFVSSSPITTTVGLRIIAHLFHTIIDTRKMAAEEKKQKKTSTISTYRLRRKIQAKTKAL